MKWAVGVMVLLLTAALILTGCGSGETAGQSTSSSATAPTIPAPDAASAENRDILYQYATLNALMAGVFDGDLTIAELVEHGDQGLGTANTLDGEMIVLEGKAYRVAYDGSVRVLGSEELTPFAVVTDFDADITQTLAGPMTFDELTAALDDLRSSANLPYAIRVDGTFAWVKTRSVPAQTKPYRTLPEVLEEQAEFEFTDVEGTIVGFWLPEFMDGANAGGYHLHFLTAARDAGGHLLDCRPANVTMTIDQTGEWNTELPTEGAFLSTELSEEQYQ